MDLDGEASDLEWLEPIFGCRYWGTAVQHTGSVTMQEGRLLTFPNILQRHVQPFELADHTKPGHCKTVVLYLVDPGIQVISTANVPCQQKEWWSEKLMEVRDGLLGKLPVESPDVGRLIYQALVVSTRGLIHTLR